jgi:hypothetical protein
MVIQIKNKDSIQKYVVELKRWGINCEVKNGSDMHFEPSLFNSTETKAYNRILNMQIEERLPTYMMATDNHKLYKADIINNMKGGNTNNEIYN